MPFLGFFSRDKVVTTTVAAFFALVAYDGERALTKIDALYDLSQANTQQIGINRTNLGLATSTLVDHETRIRVLEKESYSKKPIGDSVPTEWLEPPPETVLVQISTKS